jgi:hypothetical protein
LERSREHPTNLQRPALYVFCGRLLGNLRAGRPLLGIAVLLRTSISIPARCQKYSLVFTAGAMFPILA